LFSRCRYGQVDDSFIPTDRETGEYRCRPPFSGGASSRTNVVVKGAARASTCREIGRDITFHTLAHAGRPRGFGFVTMDTNAANQAMMELNNTGKMNESGCQCVCVHACACWNTRANFTLALRSSCAEFMGRTIRVNEASPPGGGGGGGGECSHGAWPTVNPISRLHC
jgi:RNA recognition motif-containing protein